MFHLQKQEQNLRQGSASPFPFEEDGTLSCTKGEEKQEGGGELVPSVTNFLTHHIPVYIVFPIQFI